MSRCQGSLLSKKKYAPWNPNSAPKTPGRVLLAPHVAVACVPVNKNCPFLLPQNVGIYQKDVANRASKLKQRLGSQTAAARHRYGHHSRYEETGVGTTGKRLILGGLGNFAAGRLGWVDGPVVLAWLFSLVLLKIAQKYKICTEVV